MIGTKLPAWASSFRLQSLTFKFTPLAIRAVISVELAVLGVGGGFFMETYAKSTFEAEGLKGEIVQQNHGKSRRGVPRGLHFQMEPFTQGKLVRCTRGEILDVAVDLGGDSSTFGRSVSVTLSGSNKQVFYIPRGFAHGFLAISDLVEVEYSVDNVYAPDYESGIIWNDHELAIKWPMDNPILSEKDRTWPRLSQLKLG